MCMESLENLGRSPPAEKHIRIVLAMKGPGVSSHHQDKVECLMVATGHLFKDEALLRLQDKAERLMASTGQLFEEMMATYHTLGIAELPLELHVLVVPGAHCLTVFTQGNVAASRKQEAPALVTFFEKAGRC